jgi:hypothetical protein
MTYYRVEFAATSKIAPRTKKFRTKATAEKYARRVLAQLDDNGLELQAAILPTKREMPID